MSSTISAFVISYKSPKQKLNKIHKYSLTDTPILYPSQKQTQTKIKHTKNVYSMNVHLERRREKKKGKKFAYTPDRVTRNEAV